MQQNGTNHYRYHLKPIACKSIIHLRFTKTEEKYIVKKLTDVYYNQEI